MSYKTIEIHMFSEISVIWHISHNDLVELRADTSETGKRNYIKNIISLAEGITYALRQHILNDINIKLTGDEKYILNETELELNDSGKIKHRAKRYSSKQLIKFTFKILGKVYSKSDIIDKGFSSNGFLQLQRTIDIRNRLTHPKIGNDLFVTEEEYQNVIAGYAWFYTFLIECLNGIIIEERT